MALMTAISEGVRSVGREHFPCTCLPPFACLLPFELMPLTPSAAGGSGRGAPRAAGMVLRIRFAAGPAVTVTGAWGPLLLFWPVLPPMMHDQ